MQVGNFSVSIPEGHECETGPGYVELAHGTVYRVRMANSHSSRRCDAEVTIDGKPIGSFRIAAYGSITLECSPDDKGCFTFFKADSTEGEAVGAGKISKDDRGLVQVIFRAERERVRERSVGVVHTKSSVGGQHCNTSFGQLYGSSGKEMEQIELTSAGLGFCSASKAPENAVAGVTGLTGRSSQEFTTVANLDYDPVLETIVTLRLVAVAGVRELVPAHRANPVPAPVE